MHLIKALRSLFINKAQNQYYSGYQPKMNNSKQCFVCQVRFSKNQVTYKCACFLVFGMFFVVLDFTA